MENFVKDINRDEIRSGFLVTSGRKKLWNVEIGLINEFARICKKYNLRWFAYGGTLLGAVRHKGFIPWDDDVDICMLRPDYEKFKQVAAKEIQSPYFFDAWYNFRRESEIGISPPSEKNLPLISAKHEEWFPAFPNFPITKIRDSRTTTIEFPYNREMNQGMWIDIFCFDPLPPFSNEKSALIFEIAKELLITASMPNVITEGLAKGQQVYLDRNTLEKILKLSFRERALIYEDFMSKNFHDSAQRVGTIRTQLMKQYLNWIFDADAFNDVIYLPFEEIEIPVPKGYENLLRTMYGNWHELIVSTNHVLEYSADIPFSEYYKKIM